MSNATGYTLRYRIVIRGECGPLLTSLIAGIQIESRCQAGNTCAVVWVRDQSEFWGLMNHIQDLGLHVVSLHELEGDDRQPNAGSA